MTGLFNYNRNSIPTVGNVAAFDQTPLEIVAYYSSSGTAYTEDTVILASDGTSYTAQTTYLSSDGTSYTDT